ncbi:class I SAM-dependent methyltransferase [Kordiimonas lipolytica]|uniref:Class I SAM-dependent methyltransferase n=1 Tax=Kordiimonas lipolytica TaxID=1662421 RepID=A0ABV8UGC0_9PROT|nr:class I SAM-dependent methyltransferase [Kordiimonas lipolytica]
MTIRNSLRAGAAALALSAASFGLLPAQADHHEAAIEAAVNHPDRPATDRARDALRKPAEILKFAGIKPGMTVLDINSAGGYYTELLSRTVGEEGKIYAHNGSVYWAFMKQTTPPRYEEGRLQNVVQIHDGNETFSLPPESLDAAMAVLAYHDYYFTHEARQGGGYEDVPAVLASLYAALRSGGYVVIVDHLAPAGTGPADFDTMHRIDPDVVRAQMLAAGFKLDGESSILLNPDDGLIGSPFDPAIRGKTSRFILRFVKK